MASIGTVTVGLCHLVQAGHAGLVGSMLSHLKVDRAGVKLFVQQPNLILDKVLSGGINTSYLKIPTGPSEDKAESDKRLSQHLIKTAALPVNTSARNGIARIVHIIGECVPSGRIIYPGQYAMMAAYNTFFLEGVGAGNKEIVNLKLKSPIYATGPVLPDSLSRLANLFGLKMVNEYEWGKIDPVSALCLLQFLNALEGREGEESWRLPSLLEASVIWGSIGPNDAANPEIYHVSQCDLKSALEMGFKEKFPANSSQFTVQHWNRATKLLSKWRTIEGYGNALIENRVVNNRPQLEQALQEGLDDLSKVEVVSMNGLVHWLERNQEGRLREWIEDDSFLLVTYPDRKNPPYAAMRLVADL